MIASPFYRQTTAAKKAPPFVKYISQRSLAVVLFVAFAALASIGNKPSDASNGSNTCQSSDQQSHLVLNPRQLLDNTVRSVNDAFNDPALIEYAKQQGIDGNYFIRLNN